MVYIRDTYLPLLGKSPQASAFKTFLEARFTSRGGFGGGVSVEFTAEGRELEAGDD